MAERSEQQRRAGSNAIAAGELAERLGAELRGNPAQPIRGAGAVGKAGPDELTFIGDERNLRNFQNSPAGAVLVGGELAEKLDVPDGSSAVLVVDDPQQAFLQVLAMLRPRRPRPNVGIAPAATVSPSARIGAGTNVFPGSYVGGDVTVGEDCDIYPGVYLGAGCRLGDGVTLHPNVVLYPDVVIGNRVTIHAAAVLGADGFGYRLVEGRHQKVPHYGTVRVEDDVEIGACTTIDRAMIGETVIGAGTKLDNLVMVAHNCELGRHNVMAAQVGLAGSVATGDYVTCAGQVGVADHVRLGARCTLGSKAGVPSDVPSEATYLGIPAQPAADAMKVLMAQKKLPELRKTLRQLESQVAELTSRLNALDSQQRPAA